jgi:hypothetical protein
MEIKDNTKDFQDSLDGYEKRFLAKRMTDLYSDRRDIRDILLIVMTAIIISFMWLAFADFYVYDSYCKIYYPQQNYTNITFVHLPSLIQDKSKEDRWKNESYKNKYLK